MSAVSQWENYQGHSLSPCLHLPTVRTSQSSEGSGVIDSSLDLSAGEMAVKRSYEIIPVPCSLLPVPHTPSSLKFYASLCNSLPCLHPHPGTSLSSWRLHIRSPFPVSSLFPICNSVPHENYIPDLRCVNTPRYSAHMLQVSLTFKKREYCIYCPLNGWRECQLTNSRWIVH